MAQLSPCMQAFLKENDPNVDWSKVRFNFGGNLPGSSATTYGYNVYIDEGSWSHLARSTIFHELGHVPQWLSGELTTGGYIGSSILAWFQYAGEASATYGLNGQRTPPAVNIHDRIQVEQEANSYGQRLERAYNNRCKSIFG